MSGTSIPVSMSTLVDPRDREAIVHLLLVDYARAPAGLRQSIDREGIEWSV
jgi:hypothetical protein